MRTSEKEETNLIVKFASKHNFTMKNIWCFCGVIILVLVAVIFISAGSSGNEKDVRSRTIQFKLQDIGELATQAGMFRNVQVVGNSRDIWGVTIPFTETKRIFSYDGKVKAGVNFSEIEITADDVQKTIKVVAPLPHILSCEVDEDSCEIYDETKNIFNQLEISDFNDALIALKDEARQNALDNGILEEAQKNAELLIRGMLTGLYDLNEYSVEFEWVKEEI